MQKSNFSKGPYIRFGYESRGKGQDSLLNTLQLEVLPGMITGMLGADSLAKARILELLALRSELPGLIINWDGETGTMLRQYHNDIGYMPLEGFLHDMLTVEMVIDFFQGLNSYASADNQELLQPLHTQIAGFCEKRISTLSGGMRQQVALYCALRHDPCLILLNEPTRGIDISSKQLIWKILQELSAQRKTVLMAVTDMVEVSFCDRVFIVHKGSCIDEFFPKSFIDIESIERYYEDKIKTHETNSFRQGCQ